MHYFLVNPPQLPVVGRGLLRHHPLSVEGTVAVISDLERCCQIRGGANEGEDFQLDNLLSSLSESVISIALTNGATVLFTSSGIAIGCRSNGTQFVTSASLFIALRAAKKHNKCVKIEIRHGKYISEGFLEEYDLYQAIAFVFVPSGYHFCCVPLNHEVELIPQCRRVIALGREIDGTLLSAYGTCTDSRGSEDSEYLMFSTCKLSKTCKQKRAFLDLMKPFRDIERCIGQLYSHTEGGIKVNTSKVSFGDKYPCGAWGEFKEGVLLNILKNVVALSSFNGFFIDNADKCSTILTSASLVRIPDDDTDRIIEDLRIVVRLPNNQCIEGQLERYSLHYNVALVSVKNYNVDSPASLKHDKIHYSTKVVAVGRHFESGVLMAVSGKHTWWSGRLDCKDLCYTTCKITKVGIGGPLVDVNGNFVGMNYYDPTMGTPFLGCDHLCGILNYFKTKETKNLDIRIGGEHHIVKDSEGPQDSWILYEPVYMNEEEIEDELAALKDSNRYGYMNGSFAVRK